MRVEVHALLFDFTQLGQRKYLKSTAVRKNRLVPVHELVKSAHFVYNVIARSDVQMIGIAKLHLRFKLVFKSMEETPPFIAAEVPTFINTGVCIVP